MQGGKETALLCGGFWVWLVAACSRGYGTAELCTCTLGTSSGRAEARS